ncbi:hypothetical protein [Cytobacillus sp.]|uniref:hypothetical protein n=1 Tax=Cytobacillus sp. TaxID=2675269 RepID=UPI0035118BD0
MNRKLFKVFTFLSILSLLFLLYTPLSKTEADQVPDYIDIDTFPQNIFIDMGELKPGDKIITTINIQNKGTIDFTYFTYSEFLEGSLPYFNALKVTISDEGNHILYNGFLHGLKHLDPRKLPIFKSEELKFLFEIPYELGNEYQGLTSSFNLVFSAEAPETKPPTCEEDSTQSGCEKPPSCEEDPIQSGCEEPPSCQEDPTQSGCEEPPSCKEDPSQPGCEEPPVDVPVNPQGPNNPSESGNGGTEPEKPENDTLKNANNTNNLLPDTATNIYNLLLIGGLLFVSGAVILLIYIRKTHREL